ncbi:unnamed protein product [Oppiella nova]|uniref:Uncharacterized protein n=1 Tax=Oppiella nova TaxID=334625 RepID=A0A7R9M1V3_9ACAR|nr:unnamed protein product [Oppiella nova]CAG2169155.1 unnamed protein product [Oppiella nova]
MERDTLIIVITLSAVISATQNNDKTISDQDFKNAKKVTIAIIATIGSIKAAPKGLTLVTSNQ